jgi:hypothetical protein
MIISVTSFAFACNSNMPTKYGGSYVDFDSDSEGFSMDLKNYLGPGFYLFVCAGVLKFFRLVMHILTPSPIKSDTFLSE